MESRKEYMSASLCESLREWMLKKAFEKITIKQICDKSGVIRATFYNYYDDKYDCLYSIVSHDFQDLNHDGRSSKQLIVDILTSVEQNREFYRVAYQITGQNSFEEMIVNNIQDKFETYLNQYRDENVMNRYDNKILAGFYAEGLAYIIRLFVYQKEIHLTVEDAADLAMELMSHNIFELTKKR